MQRTAQHPKGPAVAFSSTGARCEAWRWSPGANDGASPVVRAYHIDRGRQAAAQWSAGSATGRDARRFLTTVLMTDIVDSTATASRLGDRRWSDLLARHYADCRRQVEAAGGRLVNTTGDGIVAIFESPVGAVLAAIAIQAVARESGIAVRAGVHSGECERLGDGLAGVVVHIAARVCALGGPDEVMTTGTVRDLVIGSMLAFEPRGCRELKGVPGGWQVFGATARVRGRAMKE
jgi:class 3 adenylate cyclase